MRGFLYQYTKFELITIIEQYQDYVTTVHVDDPINSVEEFVEKLWEKEVEPKEENE